MILNASFFGQLKIKYNNKIVSPATDYVLSDLTDNKCWYEASENECNRKDSEWFMNRKSIGGKCAECIFNNICPSPSEIELEFNIRYPCQ